MKLYGVPASDLRSIVAAVSAAKYDGNLCFNNFDPKRSFITFTLKVSNSRGKGARNAASGRRTVNACWCAHKAVMDEIFARFPAARLVSALERYDGADDYRHKHDETRERNCGSEMQPATMGSLCEAC